MDSLIQGNTLINSLVCQTINGKISHTTLHYTTAAVESNTHTHTYILYVSEMKCHCTICTYMAERCNGDLNKHFWSHVCLLATVEYSKRRMNRPRDRDSYRRSTTVHTGVVYTYRCMCIWVSRAKCSRWQRTCTVWNYIDSHHITSHH